MRFYEENSDWEAFADFQPTQVYKQHAIWFRTPKYKNLDITEPVKVFIQLRRPSDGATSEALPFEFLPIDSGRRPYWTYKGKVYRRQQYGFFNTLLVNEAKLLANQHLGSLLEEKNTAKISSPIKHPLSVPTRSIDCSSEPNNEKTDTLNVKYPDKESYIKMDDNIKMEKSFNQIIHQVDELDEIYCENQAQMLRKLLNDAEEPTNIPRDEVFDDTKTYSSLQLAFKNPVDINTKTYEDVLTGSVNTLESRNGMNGNKRENETERPPLPPKRTKKIETYIGGSISSINQSGKPGKTLQRSDSNIGILPDTRSSSVTLDRPQSQVELPPLKHLPATPNSSTLPNPKKRSFFSKLFGRKSKTANNSRETSVTPSTNKQIYSSTKSLLVGNSLTKSTGNMSTISSNSIRIPLKDDTSTRPTVNPKMSTGNIVTGTINDNHYIRNDDFDMNLDVTEAEHYALYTTVAPYATQSEFDEMSFYYAPVEGGK